MPVVLTLPSIKGSRLSKPEMEDNLTDLRDAVNLAKYETDITTSASYTCGVKQVVFMDATAGAKVVNLPDVTTSLDKVYVIKKIDTTSNQVNINPLGAQLVEGVATLSLQTYNESLTLICDGTGWNLLTHQQGGHRTVGVKLDTTTVTNTITETLLYSHTFPANSFDKVGGVDAVVSGGFNTTVNNAEFDIIIKMNGTVVHTLNRLGTIRTNAGWKAKVSGTIRSLGATGTYVDIAGLSDGDNTYTEALSTELPIDTTAPFLYEVYVKWAVADAGSTLSCTQGKIEIDN